MGKKRRKADNNTLVVGGLTCRSPTALAPLLCQLLIGFILATQIKSTLASSNQQQVSGSIASLQQAMAQMLQVFNGNETQQQQANVGQLESNHFRLLERDTDSLLVGARNVVYNLSLSSMREQRRLEWPSSEEDVKLCRVKGKSPEQCQNYIRVLKLQAPNTLFVCGTNAYKPRCRTYLITASNYELVSEAPGEGVCPYQENQNVTSLFADGALYSATAAQFSGIDGLIHRAPLRTEQFNPKQLNSPNFVSSFQYGEHVYFLFREPAIEHINCGKTIYSRIARVCINDSGSSTRADRWTSFVKARLNCSIPGEFPFYFDEIQAATQIVSSGNTNNNNNEATSANLNPQSDLLYAVFTTPTNSIGGSAVCAFRMSDVLEAFEGPFKSQLDSNANWLPVPESRVPQPRPGSCVNDSKRLPDENVNFIKDNPLMDMAVEALWSQPLIMMASINFRFTQIAVDAQVAPSPDFTGASPTLRTDVIFVATDDGRVFKLINTHHLSSFGSLSAANYQALVRQPLSALQQKQPNGNNNYNAPTMARHYQPLASPLLAQAASSMREPLPDVSSSSVVIEELHLFDSRTPIVNMLIHYPSPSAAALAAGIGENQHPKLLVLSSKQLKAIPLSRCERALTCADCLALYDPYCAWDTRQQLCLGVGRSPLSRQQHQQQQYLPHLQPNNHLHLGANWFPPNNLHQQQAAQGAVGNHSMLAWWSQCPSLANSEPVVQAVGAPFRSLFSSHLQVPSRFDYASGHHLAHTALVAVQAPAAGSGGQFIHRQQPVSECLTFCGGLYAPSPLHPPTFSSQDGLATASAAGGAVTGSSSQQQLMMNCADFVQQHYIGGQPINTNQQQQQAGSLYTSENLYFAVIICAVFGLLLGLVFGFAIGRQTRKHDSSICSSTFDETNLYMASTGSHHGANPFAQQQQHQRLLLQHQQQIGTGNGIRPSIGSVTQQPFEASQCLLADSATYGNQQQLLLQLANQAHNQNASLRTGVLPPIPSQQQRQQSPLVNTSTSSSTHINHSQLTPNSLAAIGSSSASSTNTSSTSATVPASDHHTNQLYLNQQQLLQQHQTSNHQRSFSNTGKAPAISVAPSIKGQSFLQQQSQQLQQQQQNNKIYL